jgi:hypothetical protein
MPEKMMRTVLRPRQQHDDAAIRAYELLALSYQAAASVLTKLGKADLAWIAAERGLTAVHVCRQALCDRWPWCGPGTARARRAGPPKANLRLSPRLR